MSIKPAVSLVAVAGGRRATLELAQRIEREGFRGIYCPSPGDGLGPSEALAVATREIPLGTSYQNYWIEAGYEDEMRAVRAAIARGDDAGVQAAMSDRWLSDVTLFGGAAQVRDDIEAWRAAGVKTVIAVPSSTRGGQMVAFEELLAAFR